MVSALPFSLEIGWLDELVDKVEELGVHEVWLCLPLSHGGGVRSIMYALRHHTVAIRFIPELDDIPLLNHKVSHIAGIYSLDLSCSPMDGPPRLLKRLEDLVLGVMISLLIAPVCLLIAIAIKLTSMGQSYSSNIVPGLMERILRSISFVLWLCMMSAPGVLRRQNGMMHVLHG